MRTPKTYRRFLLRSAAALSGDIAIAAAVTEACIWIIEAASLGLFLKFMVWMLALIVGLALSQYVVHPVVRVLMADDKLDRVAQAASEATDALQRGLRAVPWPEVARRFAARHPA